MKTILILFVLEDLEIDNHNKYNFVQTNYNNNSSFKINVDNLLRNFKIFNLKKTHALQARSGKYMYF
jgi:hypothetical protein